MACKGLEVLLHGGLREELLQPLAHHQLSITVERNQPGIECAVVQAREAEAVSEPRRGNIFVATSPQMFSSSVGAAQSQIGIIGHPFNHPKMPPRWGWEILVGIVSTKMARLWRSGPRVR